MGLSKLKHSIRHKPFNLNKLNMLSCAILVPFLLVYVFSMVSTRVSQYMQSTTTELHIEHPALGPGLTGTGNPFVTTAAAAPSYKVVSVYDSDASNWNHATGMHWQYINQDVVDNMFAVGLMELTGTTSIVDAWRDIIPYRQGEQIAIKFNFNNSAQCNGGDDNVLDGLSETANAIIDGLISIGVPPHNIWIYDAQRRVVPTRFIRRVENQNVRFFGAAPDGACGANYYQTSFVAANSPHVSRFTCLGGNLSQDVIRPAQVLVDAEHLINVPIFRSHGGMASFALKNHYGSVFYNINDQGTMHAYFDPLDPMGNHNYGCNLNTENILADISNNPHIRNKTRLIVGEGMFGHSWSNLDAPIRYTSFNNDDPNIYFFGVNPIAVSSVMADSLNYERSVSPIPQTKWPNPVEHHEQLHAGAILGLGVHEHWNNPSDRKYTTIDYVRIDLDTTPAIWSLFAHVAVGGGYRTTFTVLNTGADAFSGSLILTDDLANPLIVNLKADGSEAVTGSSCRFSLPAGGTTVISAGATDAEGVKVGWAHVIGSGGTLGGVATFELENGGALFTIAGVLSAAAANAVVIPVDDDRRQGDQQGQTTGYAVANPGEEDLYIRFTVRNRDGTIYRVLNPPELNPLKAKWHVARFLWQDLNEPRILFQGSMEIAELSGKKFSMVALVMNQTRLTAVPVVAGRAIGSPMFSQVVVGGGFTTVVTLVNTGTEAAMGNVVLAGNEGQPMQVAFSSSGQSDRVDTSFPVRVEAGGMQVIAASGTGCGGDALAGWARVESTGGSLVGVATFQLVRGGTLSTIAGVLSTSGSSVATIPVNDDNTLGARSYATGYAVANPGSQNLNIRVTVLGEDATVLRVIDPPLLNPLKPGWHVARFLWQDLEDQNLRMKGSMILTSQGGETFPVVALVMNQQLFTAIPVIPAKAPDK
jgi:hypothetical protein